MTPTSTELFFFDNNGYLLLENFLAPDHVKRLRDALMRVTARRRELAQAGTAHTGMTEVLGEKSTRIFYILDDDPLF